MEMKERYVETFYDNLAKGKIMGQRCKSCGTYRVFPVPVCWECQGTDLELTELSKEGRLLFFNIPKVVAARFEPYMPCVSGCIQIKEGAVLWCIVEGIDIENPDKEFARLPIDVKIELKEIAGNVVPTAKIS